MATPLLLSSMPITLFFAILAVLCAFSVITFLCGSDNKLKNLSIEEEEEKAATTTTSKEHKLNSNIGNRALSMVKMLSWRKFQEQEQEVDHEGTDYSDHDEEALWRKNILMGEKCRPLTKN